jgi:hypothetical protein
MCLWTAIWESIRGCSDQKMVKGSRRSRNMDEHLTGKFTSTEDYLPEKSNNEYMRQSDRFFRNVVVIFITRICVFLTSL